MCKIERSQLRAMLRDAGVHPLPAGRHNNDESDYSEKLYIFLETTARQHALASTGDLIRLMEDRMTSKPYQFVVEEFQEPVDGCTHQTYLLDYPGTKLCFPYVAGADLSALRTRLEELVYESHRVLMDNRCHIADPIDYSATYHGVIHQLNLGELYAIKIAAWNEALDPQELSPETAHSSHEHYH